MDFKLRTKSKLAVLTIKTGNAEFVEDLASYNREKERWFVDEDIIEKFISLANDLNRFNGTSDVEFVKNIYEAFLSDNERKEFLEKVQLIDSNKI